MEFDAHLDTPTVALGTVERVDLVVDRLCRAYAITPAQQLLPRVDAYRRHVGKLLGGKATPSARQNLLVAAGWLSALLACLHVDLGHRRASAAARSATFSLGMETRHPELMAWAQEIRAWIALVDERFQDAAEHARLGQRMTRMGTSAAVQLAVQEAKASAQLGDGQAAEAALERARAALAKLPASSTPDHHFVFDPTKLTFFAGTCYVWLGQDEAAEEYTHEVIAHSRATGRLTRLDEARVNLALVALHRGEVDEATAFGRQALRSPRLCATTWGRLAELDNAFRTHDGDAATVRDFHEQYVLMRRTTLIARERE